MRGKWIVIGLVVLATTAPARAGGRWGVGVYFGRPYYRPYWGPSVVVRPAPAYYYYAPPPVIVQSAPVVAAPAVAAPAYPPDAETPPPPTLPAPTPRAARLVSSRADFTALNDPSPQTRADAALRLGRSKDARAVMPLARALEEDKSPPVREAVARALGLIGSADALPALQRAASADQDHDVRKASSFAAEVIRASLR